MGRVIKQSLMTLVVASFCLLTSAAAYAVETTEQGAADLKAKLTTLLDDRKKMFSSIDPDETMGLVYTGDVKVTPENGYYNAVLPEISFVFDPETKASFGSIVANIIPDTDEQWRVSMAMPSKMSVSNEGKAVFEVNFGQQKISGIWNPKLDMYPKMDVKLSNVTFQLVDDIEDFSFSGKIASIQNYLNLNKISTGNYSGPQKFNMQNMQINGGDQETKVNVSIDSMVSNTEYIDVDLESLASLKNLFIEMETNINENDSAAMQKEFGRLYKVLKNVADEATGDFSIKGIRVNVQDENDPVNFEIASVDYKASVVGLKKDKAILDISNSMSGLKVNGVPVELSDFIPSSTGMGFRFENIPYQSILSKAETDMNVMLDEAEKSPEEMNNDVMANLGGAYLQMLTQSGSKMKIYDTFMKSAAIDIDFSGDIEPNSQSPFSTVAALKLTIAGLDEALQKYGEMAQRGELSQDIQMAMQPMAMLQSFGQQETTADGVQVRAYNLQVTETGQVMLNGSDMSMMMGGLIGGAMTQGGAQQGGAYPQQSR